MSEPRAQTAYRVTGTKRGLELRSPRCQQSVLYSRHNCASWHNGDMPGRHYALLWQLAWHLRLCSCTSYLSVLCVLCPQTAFQFDGCVQKRMGLTRCGTDMAVSAVNLFWKPSRRAQLERETTTDAMSDQVKACLRGCTLGLPRGIASVMGIPSSACLCGHLMASGMLSVHDTHRLCVCIHCRCGYAGMVNRHSIKPPEMESKERHDSTSSTQSAKVKMIVAKNRTEADSLFALLCQYMNGEYYQN
eukprot:Lankesteria_metandrocarpae@DN4975_c0_g1_i2.p1